MQHSKKLNEINKNLRLLGYKIEVKDKETVVKLPLFCSVSIFEDGELLRTEPRFGYMSRTSATWLVNSLFYAFIFLLYILSSDIRQLLFFGILAVCSGVWDVYRYILTENLIARVEPWVIAMQTDVVEAIKN